MSSSIDPKNFTRDQLVALVRARVVYSPAQLAVVSGLNKSQLALMLDTATATATALSAPKSARTLCESDLPGTTSELRRLAVQRGIAKASTLTKKQLCVALAAVEHESSVQDEEVELPAGFLDMVTREVMIDPVVASDGYSYGYKSLRNMFLFAAAIPQRRVLSLKDPSLELENPFPGVPGWPTSFPLIRNHDLRHSIDEWLLQHGLSNNDFESEEEKELVPRVENLDHERAISTLVDLTVLETLVRLDEMRERRSQSLAQERMSVASIDALRRDIEGMVLSSNQPLEWEQIALERLRNMVLFIAPELRFNALVQTIKAIHLLTSVAHKESVGEIDITYGEIARFELDVVDVETSFAELPRTQESWSAGRRDNLSPTSM